MSSRINEMLRSTFETATLRKEAQTLRRAPEWAELKTIQNRHAKLRSDADQRFRAEYKTRVEQERQRLIHKAGSKTRDHIWKVFGADKFDKAAMDRQAHRNVRHRHHKLQARLERLEKRDLSALLSRSAETARLREKPRQAFERATDRRSGVDRRQRIRSRD